VDMAREIASEIPDAELTVINDAGHLSNIEKPVEFNAAVLTFLRRHAKR
jgi:pimeloyl-ACP methyl ester carboxylesterase